MKIASLDAKSL